MLDEFKHIYVDKNKVVNLTRNETKILLCLMKNEISTVKEIAESVGYDAWDKYIIRTILTQICVLRKKLKGLLDIVCVKTVGYKLEYVKDGGKDA